LKKKKKNNALSGHGKTGCYSKHKLHKLLFFISRRRKGSREHVFWKWKHKHLASFTNLFFFLNLSFKTKHYLWCFFLKNKIKQRCFEKKRKKNLNHRTAWTNRYSSFSGSGTVRPFLRWFACVSVSRPDRNGCMTGSRSNRPVCSGFDNLA
jgi:hypothetical protein